MSIKHKVPNGVGFMIRCRITAHDDIHMCARYKIESFTKMTISQSIRNNPKI